MKKKSLFFKISNKNKIIRKLYLFYNIYIRNKKYLKKSSQFGEDEIIINLFDENYKGFYLDIGCYHPTKHNNTYQMYKKGWRGINIDLNPFTIELFNFFRKRDINVNTAISDDDSTKELFFLNELNTENTIDPNHIDFLKKHHNVRDQEITKQKITAKTFSQIINTNKLKHIDFFNLDVEGHELNILKTIDFDKIFINVICIEMIEHNEKSIKNNLEIKAILKKNNYELIDKVDINHIYKKNNII